MRRQSGRSDAGFGVRDELFVLVVVGLNVLLYYSLWRSPSRPPSPPFPGWVSRCLTLSFGLADTVLSLGGGKSPSEVFRSFRGRDPSPEALLRHNGLAE